MRSTLLLFVTLFGILTSCQEKHESSAPATGTDTTANAVTSDTSGVTMDGFKETYKDFFYSIIDGKPETFNKYIHPDLGLYIIDTKGAIPMVTNVKDISTYVRPDNKSFFEFDRSKVGYELIEEELPKVNCDNGPDFYSKQGAFTQAVNNLKAERPWENSKFEKGELEKIDVAAETVMVTVINTSNYRYYFSQMGGKWYVTFIDLRKPCNA
jgi:hypothetical protein